MNPAMALTLFYASKQKSTFDESVYARLSQSVENKRQVSFFPPQEQERFDKEKTNPKKS